MVDRRLRRDSRSWYTLDCNILNKVSDTTFKFKPARALSVKIEGCLAAYETGVEREDCGEHGVLPGVHEHEHQQCASWLFWRMARFKTTTSMLMLPFYYCTVYS